MRPKPPSTNFVTRVSGALIETQWFVHHEGRDWLFNQKTGLHEPVMLTHIEFENEPDAAKFKYYFPR